MCSIIGAHLDRGDDNHRHVLEMMATTAHRGPDEAGLVSPSGKTHAADIGLLSIPEEPADWALGHLRLAITGEQGFQPMSGCKRRFWTAFNGEIWNHEELRERLSDHDLDHDSDAAILPHLIEEHLDAGESLVGAVAQTMAEIDGEYAFVAVNDDEAVLARDPLGIKPLYFDHERGGFAFASEQKALWTLGLDAQRVPPNRIVVLNPDGVGYREGPVARDEPPTPSSREEALRRYGEAVEQAVAKRVRGVEHAVSILSGGVDSAMIAAASQRLGQRVTCYVAGVDGAPDVRAAQGAADGMGLDLRVASLEPDVVAEWLPELIWSIEARNQIHVETALPLYAVCREIAGTDARVLLTGQGADELMAGYSWYPEVLAQEGREGLRAQMRRDRDLLFKETLEREDRVSMSQSLELRVPFLDPRVVSVADAVPIEYLLNGDQDPLGKRLHRSLAAEWGVPEAIAWRPKEAAQHGSGSRDVLKQAAEMVEPSTPPDHYEPDLARVGSSQRYGHKYADDADPWSIDRELQWRLDLIASEVGLLPSVEADAHEANPLVGV